MNTITIETTTKDATLSSTSLEVFNDIIPFSVAFTTSGTSSTEQVLQLGYSDLSVGIRVGSLIGELIASSELWEIASGSAQLLLVLNRRAQEVIATGGAASVYIEVTIRAERAGTTRYSSAGSIATDSATAIAAAAVAGLMLSALDFEMTAIAYDVTYTDVIASAVVKWADGGAGVFTTTTINTTWHKVDAFTVTHAGLGKTVTQSAVTRNAFGAVATKPALSIA